MKFRYAVLAAAVVAASAIGWFGWRTAQAPSATAGPIVLISIDTLRADRLPIYGYADNRTPAIDALAADGVVFDHAWAHAPLTLPSHVSMLTGRLPFEHGVRDNMGFALKPQTPTLASVLSASGFDTGGFVSAYVLRKDTGIGQGFATFDDTLSPASPEVPIGEVQREGGETIAAAERWLNSRQSRRFFLFLHLYEPHSPYTPPDRFRNLKPYDGEVAYTDELVGRLLASLKSKGLYDDALVLFVSDHGEGLGDHGEQEHGLFLYTESVRVPLIVKLPRQRRAGTRVTEPVQHIDLVPTILDLVAAPSIPALRGRSLVPALDGKPVPEQGIYAEAMYGRYHYAWSELYSLTDARYRLIRAPRDELYDIQDDPGERHSLAGEREQTRVAMRQALDRVMAGSTIDTPGAVSAEDRERLKALGYIGMQATAGSAPGFESLPDPKDKIHVLEQYRAGLDLVRSGDLSAAIRAFQALTGENPGLADAWGELAGLFLRSGRLEEALGAYRRLVEAAPHDPAAIVSVVQTLVDLGRFDEAKRQAEGALPLMPDVEGRWRASIHKLLMRIALAGNDLATARAEAKLAEGADPQMPLTDYLEGLIAHDAGRFQEALPRFEAALRESRNRTFQVPEVRYYLADTLGRLGRYDEAERLFREELRLFPASFRSRAGLAMLYQAQGRPADAAREIEAMLRASPSPASFALAAQLWDMFGEPRRAADTRLRASRVAR